MKRNYMRGACSFISNFASVMHHNSRWYVATAFQNLMGYLIVMICINFRKRLLVFLWYCFQTYNISIEPLSWVSLYICHIFITWHFDDNGVNCFRCSTISLCSAKLRCLRTERYLHGCFDIICLFIKLLWTGIFLHDRQCVSRTFDYIKHANVKEQGIFYKELLCPQSLLSSFNLNQHWCEAEGQTLSMYC